MTAIPGLHHVTAICADAQANVDFFVKVLGQRFVKKTVNFDDPQTYHLYYGDRDAAPGSIMTYFPFADAYKGRAGPGMATAVAYAAAPSGFDAVMERLALDGTDFGGPSERFGARVLTLHDPDGLPVEIIEREGADASAPVDGFHSVTLRLADTSGTARLLSEHFGYSEVGEETAGGTTRLRFAADGGGRAGFVDVVRHEGRDEGRQGAGSIHHVAFRARTEEEQKAWREKLLHAGFQVTPVIDRQYFNAIYFREPGGVLFEIATDPPGFAVDEPADALGQSLKLPPQYEPMRERIEKSLAPLSVPTA